MNLCLAGYELVISVLLSRLAGWLAALVGNIQGEGTRPYPGSFFGSLARPLIQRRTLVKRRCRRSMHIHINETKSRGREQKRSESMKLSMKRLCCENLD